MVYVGTMMGLLNVLEKIVSEPEPVTPKRWSWLPEPQPQPGLRPLTGEEINHCLMSNNSSRKLAFSR